MATHNHAKPRGSRIEVKVLQAVENVDHCGMELYDGGCRQAQRPGSFIYISSNHNYWSDGFQNVNDLGLAHIARVDN